MINNDCELDISPELDSCSSSLSSTQENTPLLGPLHQPAAAAASTDFTLENASMILENFQLSFLESLDDQLQEAAQGNLSLSSQLSPTSPPVNNIPNFHLSFRSPSSFLFDPSPLSAAAIQAPSVPISIVNSTQPPTVHAGGASSSSSNSNHHTDFFDTDVIMDRSGEEVNFLRGPQSLYSIAGATGAPDTSNFNANYPNYYLSQDSFAIANTYQSDNEPDHSDHHSVGSASTDGTRTACRRHKTPCQTYKKKAAAVASAYNAAPLMHDILTASSSPFTNTHISTVKSANGNPNSYSDNNENSKKTIFDNSSNFVVTDGFFPLLSTNSTNGSSSSSSDGRTNTIVNDNFHNDDSSFNADSFDNGYSSPFLTSQKDFQLLPEKEKEEEEEESFSLFPPIIYKQFDPRYAIPLLPDSAPPGTVTAPLFK